MKFKYIFKYMKDYVRLGFNFDGDTKFSKKIIKNIIEAIF